MVDCPPTRYRRPSILFMYILLPHQLHVVIDWITAETCKDLFFTLRDTTVANSGIVLLT